MGGGKNNWLALLADTYCSYLETAASKTWPEYLDWLEHNCFWAYLGTYRCTEQAAFLEKQTFKCDFFDAWVFLIWVETVWRYFREQGQLLNAAEICQQLAAYIGCRNLQSHWEKRTTSRAPLMKNPALQGALSLANLTNLINWLENEDKEKSRVRAASFKRALLEGAIYLAWADEKLLFDEKEGLRYQIAAAGLRAEMTNNLLALLDHQPDAENDFKQYLELLKRSKLSSFEQRVLLTAATVSSLMDGEQNHIELTYLNTMAGALGLDESFLNSLAIELTQVLADNPAVRGTEASWLLGRLQRKITTDLTESLQDSATKIWQEVQETGDLFMLLSKAAAGRPMSDFERRRIKSQLADIAKVVPALAIFMLPGGMVFLGVLLKVLPFNIMPSAFNKKEDTHEI